MKKVISLVLALCVCVAVGLPGAFAQTTTTVPVYAPVPQTLNLDVIIRSVPSSPKGLDPWNPSASTVVDTVHGVSGSMDFGLLRWHPENNINLFLSDVYFAAFLYASTSGRSYTISQQCSGITNGVHNLNNSLIMTPDYQPGDTWDGGGAQGDRPSTDNFQQKAFAFGDHPIYVAPSGITRIVRCYYGLATGDPSLGEPAQTQLLNSDTPSGHYTGTVTFTLTLN